MAIEFQSRRVNFTAGTGPKRFEGPGTFGGNIRSAETAIKSFRFDYASGDHHMDVIQAKTGIIDIQGQFLNFFAECNYVDQRPEFPSDSYTGFIDVLIVADVA
jgi:hypothetical protein